jgi:sugar lactone lactonase YvrE
MNLIAKALVVMSVSIAGMGAVPAVAGPALAAAGSPPPAAGRITTVAGGAGGPGPGRSVAVVPCDVILTGGRVLFSDQNGALRQLNPRTGGLTTVAGNGVPLYSGDGGPAANAGLAGPCMLAADRAGDVALADQLRVRLIAARTGSLFGQPVSAGHIYTVAGGGGSCCVPPAGGIPATSFYLLSTAVAFDQAGNLLLAASGIPEVLVVAVRSGSFYGQSMTAGDIYSIAGTGHFGFSGDGGPATAAAVDVPTGLAVDAAGNVVISDASNYRIRVVAGRDGTFYGVPMTAGDIYTIAGQHFGGYYGDGGPATTAELCNPEGLAFDRAGNVLVADSCNNRVRVVVVRTGRFYGRAMKAGFIYSVAGGPGYGDGAPAWDAGLAGPEGVAVDAAGNVLISDPGHNLLRVVAERSGRFYGRAMRAGHIYFAAGNGQQSISGIGGPAALAELGTPQDIANGRSGVLIAEQAPVTAVRLLAGRSGHFFGQKMTAGDLYTVMKPGSQPLRNGGPAAGAFFPGGVGADADGNMLLTDTAGNRVWTVAIRTGRFYGRPMKAGHVYAIAGNGTLGITRNGRLASRASLELAAGVTADHFGDVVFAELGQDYGVNALSISRVWLVAARTGRFYGIAMSAGHIYQVAGARSAGDGPSGGLALGIEINASHVRADRAGNLVLADTGNNKIRVVARGSGTYYGQAMTAGHLYTVAGNGTAGFAGDSGPAIAAELNGPEAVGLDPAGNLLITDTGNNRIRVVAGRDGTFYGVPMTAGDIYTIAGQGAAGFAGDGGPATLAELSGPAGITATAGGVLIADTGNLRLRYVAG